MAQRWFARSEAVSAALSVLASARLDGEVHVPDKGIHRAASACLRRAKVDIMMIMSLLTDLVLIFTRWSRSVTNRHHAGLKPAESLWTGLEPSRSCGGVWLLTCRAIVPLLAVTRAAAKSVLFFSPNAARRRSSQRFSERAAGGYGLSAADARKNGNVVMFGLGEGHAMGRGLPCGSDGPQILGLRSIAARPPRPRKRRRLEGDRK
jgi:hypothetical protein